MVPRGGAQWRLVLAEAALLRGDPAVAGQQVDRAARVVAFEPDAVVLHDWLDDLQARVSARRRERDTVVALGLTNAELRVLEQLPTHRSLEEIGEHLYVSRNTVKSHTLAIYRKLGVARRGEAVIRARELGLLADTDPSPDR